MSATIIYRVNSQKKEGYFDAVLAPKVLRDICFKVTGQKNFQIEKDPKGYNRGRLLLIMYKGIKNYISLSETSIESRNSSIQSVPTAINLFYADKYPEKRLFYYFLNHKGNAFTPYHIFIYRLMLTAGMRFVNMNEYYTGTVEPYSSADEIIEDRKRNKDLNVSNKSSFISRSANSIQIYAKTYGASKYESTLFGVALSKIADKPIELFNICEKDLKSLPSSSLATLNTLGSIKIINTSMTLERDQYFERSDKTTFRSPTYLYNLMDRIGDKRCALCGCEIPEIIQGAHVWGVAEIAKHQGITDDEKFYHSINGHNGIWLCQNHHKLFDSDILLIDNEGRLHVKNSLQHKAINFISDITTNRTIPDQIMSDEFRGYLHKHNASRSFKDTLLLSI